MSAFYQLVSELSEASDKPKIEIITEIYDSITNIYLDDIKKFEEEE
jgi:hypothetical protein